MKNIAASATINDQNWLVGSGEVIGLVSSYDGTSHRVGTLPFDTTRTTLFKDPAAGVGGILGKVATLAWPDLFAPCGSPRPLASAPVEAAWAHPRAHRH